MRVTKVMFLFQLFLMSSSMHHPLVKSNSYKLHYKIQICCITGECIFPSPRSFVQAEENNLFISNGTDIRKVVRFVYMEFYYRYIIDMEYIRTRITTQILKHFNLN